MRVEVMTEVADHTGFPMLDGRVKTLHRKSGGFTGPARRLTHDGTASAPDHDTIDLLVVNLYPFEATVLAEDAIENIDIGGQPWCAACQKLGGCVGVLTDARYAGVL
jgi:phosphoribosylaminoimidazolecarboxamide formyltransferase/IMP cyclohydrolase